MYDPLLYTIQQYAGNGNLKPIIYWDRFKATVERRIDMYTNRLIDTAMPSAAWVRFLKILLNMIPVTSLLEIPSTSSRYATMMLDVASRLDDYLAPNNILKTRTNLFVSDNNSTVQEYLIPCRSETPLLDLPLGDNINYWKSVHPVRILYCDTLELCGNFYHADFQYEKSVPRQLIVAIDTPALIFKYMAYCENCVKEKTSISMSDFIQQHLLSNLYYDIFNCWIFHALNMFIADADKSNPTDAKTDITVHQNIVTDVLTEQATEDLTKYWINLANKRYNLDDLMIAPWFSGYGWASHSLNLQEFAFNLDRFIQIPYLRQSAYIRFMVDFPIVKLVVKVNNLLNTSIGRKMNKDINILVSRFKMANVLVACQNTSLREKLSRELDEIIKISRPGDSSPSEAETRTEEF